LGKDGSSTGQNVEVVLPVKQGLKHCITLLTTSPSINVEVVLPVKQGLKQKYSYDKSHYSSVEVVLPVKQGLKHAGGNAGMPKVQMLKWYFQ